MKKIILSFLLLVAFSSSSISAEKGYRMCSIAGYFDGAKKEFMYGIAMRIVMDKKLMNNKGTNATDPICEALYEKAQDTGVADLKRGKYNFKFIDTDNYFLQLKDPLSVFHYGLNTHFNSLGNDILSRAIVDTL